MNENLSEMVKTGEPIEGLNAINLDMESEVTAELDAVEASEPQEEVNNVEVIDIASLSEWITTNVSNFPNITKPTVSITGIDPAEQMILITISKDADGNDVKTLRVFREANLVPVLDKPAMDMQIYNNNTFRVVYNLGDGIYVKSYGVRKGLINVFCNDVNDLLIPYAVTRTKKNDTNIEIITNDVSAVVPKLNETLDFEALQLLYKQSSKAEGLTTKLDAIKWLIERQGPIEDINHHLQIDNVIMTLLV